MSRTLGPLRGVAGSLLQRMKHKPPLVRLGSALCDGGSREQIYDAFRGVFSSAAARRLAEWLMGTGLHLEAEAEEEAQEQEQGHDDERDSVSAMELRRYMRNQLLRDSDVMSMAHGLELRVPLVDSALFDVVSRIPARLRLRPGKQLLLDAVPEIPDWIRTRPKSGFLFPYEDWLSTPEWKAMFAEAMRDVPVPMANWYQRWAVFVFRHWQSELGVSA
jgi:asparagine synthase (glutamine-hydrolysing)